MKKIILVLLLSLSTVAFAHGPHYHGHWHHQGNHQWGWVAPVIVGGVIGYELAKPNQNVIVQQTPPPIVYQQQNCSPWTQIQNPDGTITMTRTCY